MPTGILAHPVGPGPAAPAQLQIDSNATFPQYLGNYGFRAEFRDTSATITVPNFDGQGQLILIPTTDLVHSQYVGTSSIPSVLGVKGMSVSGNSVHFDLQEASYRNLFWNANFNAYKIWPTANRSYGVTFYNSADFFSLTDAASVGQCIWAYHGAVGDGFQIPQIGGFDMNRSIVFMHWDQGDTVVTYAHQTRTIHVTHNHSTEGNRGQTIGDARIVVFADGAAITPHQGGFNIFAPAANGGACVFSTYNTPFLIRGFISTAGGNPGIAMPMVCLTTAGLIGESSGGFSQQHYRGFTNQGGVIGTGWGNKFAEWGKNYSGLLLNNTYNLTMPVLSAVDYFA